MRMIACLMLGLMGLTFAQPAMATPDIQEILRRADQSRGNMEGISWEVIVKSIEDDEEDTATYQIKARGFDISGISLDPPKYKGNKILQVNSNMWFYKPGLSKPIPISQRQKLMGKASYGDIAATNYANDYDATLLPDEKVDEEDCYVFDLRSKNDKTTYDRITYWVSKMRDVGVRADYYTVSGKKIKSAKMEYRNSIDVDGEMRPFISKITMYDTLINEDVTYLDLTKPKFEPLADYVFNLNLFMK